MIEKSLFNQYGVLVLAILAQLSSVKFILYIVT
jgi:hypothetical protein